MHLWYRSNVLLAYFHAQYAGAEGALKNAPTEKKEFDEWMNWEVDTEGIMKDLFDQTTIHGKALLEAFEEFQARLKERKNNTNINASRKDNWN